MYSDLMQEKMVSGEKLAAMVTEEGSHQLVVSAVECSLHQIIVYLLIANRNLKYSPLQEAETSSHGCTEYSAIRFVQIRSRVGRELAC